VLSLRAFLPILLTIAPWLCFQTPAENQRDSASEPDEEDMGDPWLRLLDNARGGVPYWQNFATNEITYDEPEDELAHEKNMIGKRVKIYWVVQVRGTVSLCVQSVRVPVQQAFRSGHTHEAWSLSGFAMPCRAT
jgi:hypothetical protein